MNIEIQFVDTGVIDSVEALVKEKLNQLFEKYSWITNAAVFLKVEDKTGNPVSICEIRLSVPGPQLFASDKNTNFESAIIEVIKQLEVQLKKHKSKLHQH